MKSPSDSSGVAPSSSLLLVGIVARPHGLSGEVSVQIVTDFPRRFAPGGLLTWIRRQESRPLEIVSARPHAGRMLIRFAGVSDSDAARDLAGGELFIGQREAAPAPPGFFYSHEIEGFRCVDSRGDPLGVVRGLSQTPAGPLLSIETTAGKEALVPFVEEMIRQVDRESRRVVLDPPEGLLDL